MKFIASVRIATFIAVTRFFIGVVGLGGLAAFSLLAIYRCGEQSILRNVGDMALMVDHIVERRLLGLAPGEVTPSDIQELLEVYLGSEPGVRYAVLRTDGTPLQWGTPEKTLTSTSLSAPEVQTALRGYQGSSIRADGEGVQTIYAATALLRENETYGVFVLAVPFHQRMAGTYQTMLGGGILALFMLAMIAAEGYFSNRYISRPLERLGQVAEQFSQCNLNSRAEPDGPREIIRLTSTFNDMASRLQNNLESLHSFVGNASHELRTPLTSIKLYVNALSSGAMEEPEVAQRFLGQIDQEIDRLVHMVNDMLDLSQIEGCQAQANRQNVNLLEMVREVQAFWEVRSKQSGLTLTLHAENELPAIHGDPFRLRQMFDNLLDNAIKNTPAGGSVDIQVRACPYPRVIHIDVQDTGTGIAAEHLPHLFERFYRVDKQTKNGHSTGGGLGLAIARSIARSHGGQIGVNSLPERGSTFWVELPYETGGV